MYDASPGSGRLVALIATALLGGGLVAGCEQGQSPGGQAAASPSPAAPAAAASPAAPSAAESPAGAASPAGATAAATPAGAAGGAAAGAAAGDAERGRQIFAQNCATCHGPEGKGDGPAAAALNPKPQDLTDAQWKHGGSPEDIYKTITNGVPGTAMVSWSSLPEADRRALVAYILSLQKK